MSAAFRRALLDCYGQAYGVANRVDPGEAPLKWVKKIGWTESGTEHRFVFHRGDFLAFGDNSSRYAQVKNILIHSLEGDTHPFLYVQEYVDTGRRDEVLDMREFEKVGGELLLGLPDVGSEFLYMPACIIAEALLSLEWLVVRFSIH